MASRFEDEYKKFMEDRPKGKSKTSFASRFSIYGMLSSIGAGSSGKRRTEKSGGVSSVLGGRYCY